MNVLVECFRTKYFNFQRNSDYAAKKKQKVASKECKKIVSLIFPQAKNNKDKDKKFEKSKQIAFMCLKLTNFLNNDPLTNLLNNVPIFP